MDVVDIKRVTITADAYLLNHVYLKYRVMNNGKKYLRVYMDDKQITAIDLSRYKLKHLYNIGNTKYYKVVER